MVHMYRQCFCRYRNGWKFKGKASTHLTWPRPLIIPWNNGHWNSIIGKRKLSIICPTPVSRPLPLRAAYWKRSVLCAKGLACETITLLVLPFAFPNQTPSLGSSWLTEEKLSTALPQRPYNTTILKNCLASCIPRPMNSQCTRLFLLIANIAVYMHCWNRVPSNISQIAAHVVECYCYYNMKKWRVLRWHTGHLAEVNININLGYRQDQSYS